MVDRRRLARVAVPAVAALMLLAWVAQAQQVPSPAKPFTQPEFVEADCPMWFDRPRGVRVDCGYVSVLEDRVKPDGNVIRLAVARLRGSSPSPHPDPVIYLAGGPGASAMESIDWFIDDARFIWQERDLILMDQRGVGHSEPRLECPDYRRQNAELRELDLDPDEDLQRQVDALLACKRNLSEQGIDMSAYSPEAVAADIVSVAEAMGYRAYNLYGSSYGTTLALTVMRDFPDNLRGVILDGVLPPQVRFTETTYANAASALKAFLRHCEADRACAQRYPDLEQELWQVVDRYAAHPTTTSYFDTYLNESFEADVNGYFVLWRVSGSLRSASWIPYVPFLLHHIAGGNEVVAGAFIAPTSRGRRSAIDNTAAWASLWCYSEGRSTDRTEILADRAAHPRLVDPENRSLVPSLCARWHDPTIQPVDRTPVTSDIPTLLLSGQFDPTTPPRWAELAARTLSRSYSFVVPMAGHGVGIETSCGRKLVEAFLDAPSDDPSPACFPIADRERSGFRTIYLNRGVRVRTLERITNQWDGVRSLVPRVGVTVALSLHLSALIVWSLGAVLGRAGSRTELAAPRVGRPRAAAAAVIAISIGFSWSVGAAEDELFRLAMVYWLPWLPQWLFKFVDFVFIPPDELRLMSEEVVQNFGYYPWVRPLFVIPYLTAAATLYVLYLAFRSWREKWWTRLGRVHYSIVAITLAWYPFHLAFWGFIL